MKRFRALPILILMLALSLVLLSACGDGQGTPQGDDDQAGNAGDQGEETQDPGSTGGEPAGQGVAGQSGGGEAPADFPLPVYDDWRLMLDTVDGASRILIFLSEADRDATLEQYAQDLTDMGLDVTVDGFRIIAVGEVDGQAIDFQGVFRINEEGSTHISMALKDAE